MFNHDCETRISGECVNCSCENCPFYQMVGEDKELNFTVNDSNIVFSN